MATKIAIFEDEEILLQALSIELTSAGFEVITAVDGESGMELLQKDVPDLLILDIMMPKKDGFEVLREMQEDPVLTNIPVIVLTNLGQEDDKHKAVELGADDYYVKSDTELDKLTAKVNELLQKQRTASPAPKQEA